MSAVTRRLKLGVLGSTGSIGQQTLDIVRKNPESYSIEFLTAHSSTDVLSAQIKEFSPSSVALSNKEKLSELSVGEETRLYPGSDGLLSLLQQTNVDVVVVGIIGFAALAPVLEAIKRGIHIALANKEVLVAASSLVKPVLAESKSILVPVDSEHNSLFQCMMGRSRTEIAKVVLTASGGPFLHSTLDELRTVSPEQAAKHPNWSMGRKISIDSATMMNKGLEVIEAAALFDLPGSQIEVVVHPQSIVHGFVEYQEGTSIAALYHPDMRIPIAFALDYIAHATSSRHSVSSTGAAMLNLAQEGTLEFFAPDFERFPCLRLAYEALEIGGCAPAVLNASNEVAVDAFCEGTLCFMDIPTIVEKSLRLADTQPPASIEEIIKADARAREHASKFIAEAGNSEQG